MAVLALIMEVGTLLHRWEVAYRDLVEGVWAGVHAVTAGETRCLLMLRMLG